jgi:hypothetical protein
MRVGPPWKSGAFSAALIYGMGIAGMKGPLFHGNTNSTVKIASYPYV